MPIKKDTILSLIKNFLIKKPVYAVFGALVSLASFLMAPNIVFYIVIWLGNKGDIGATESFFSVLSFVGIFFYLLAIAELVFGMYFLPKYVKDYKNTLNKIESIISMRSFSLFKDDMETTYNNQCLFNFQFDYLNDMKDLINSISFVTPNERVEKKIKKFGQSIDNFLDYCGTVMDVARPDLYRVFNSNNSTEIQDKIFYQSIELLKEYRLINEEYNYLKYKSFWRFFTDIIS